MSLLREVLQLSRLDDFYIKPRSRSVLLAHLNLPFLPRSSTITAIQAPHQPKHPVIYPRCGQDLPPNLHFPRVYHIGSTILSCCRSHSSKLDLHPRASDTCPQQHRALLHFSLLQRILLQSSRAWLPGRQDMLTRLWY